MKVKLGFHSVPRAGCSGSVLVTLFHTAAEEQVVLRFGAFVSFVCCCCFS